MCVYCGMKAFSFSLQSQNRSNFVASDVSTEQLCVCDATLELVPMLPPISVADAIIENAKVLTLDAKTPLTQALAISGNKICRFSKDCGWEPQRSPSTRIIDAGGRTVILGSHSVLGRLTGKQEVSWNGVSSLERALEMLKNRAEQTPSPQWIHVSDDWEPGQFAERRVPTLDAISAACSDVPCFVMKLHGCAFINRAGLRALGWTRKTPVPSGGLVARDGNGDPFGMLIPAAGLNGFLAAFITPP